MTEFLCVVYIHSFIKVDCRYSSNSDDSRLAIQRHILNRDLYGSSSVDFPVVELKGATPPTPPPNRSFTGPQPSLGDFYCTYFKL